MKVELCKASHVTIDHVKGLGGKSVEPPSKSMVQLSLLRLYDANVSAGQNATLWRLAVVNCPVSLSLVQKRGDFARQRVER